MSAPASRHALQEKLYVQVQPGARFLPHCLPDSQYLIATPPLVKWGGHTYYIVC